MKGEMRISFGNNKSEWSNSSSIYIHIQVEVKGGKKKEENFCTIKGVKLNFS